LLRSAERRRFTMSRVRVRHGDNEIEVEGADDFIDKQLKDFYAKVEAVGSRAGPLKLKQEMLEPTPKRKAGKPPTPAEFYKLKGKTDGISQVLIFAKYLEEYKEVSEFKRGDINALAKEAKLAKDIHPQYFTNAVKQGLLRSHGKGLYSLTLSAESVLSSM
jgi:hypothetical protein